MGQPQRQAYAQTASRTVPDGTPLIRSSAYLAYPTSAQAVRNGTRALRRLCYSRRHVRTEWRSGSISQGPKAQTAPSAANASANHRAAWTRRREGVDARRISRRARRERSVGNCRTEDRADVPCDELKAERDGEIEVAGPDVAHSLTELGLRSCLISRLAGSTRVRRSTAHSGVAEEAQSLEHPERCARLRSFGRSQSRRRPDAHHELQRFDWLGQVHVEASL